MTQHAACASDLAVHGVRVRRPRAPRAAAPGRPTTGTCCSAASATALPMRRRRSKYRVRDGRLLLDGADLGPRRRAGATGPAFYDLTTADGVAVREDRPPARRGRAGHDGRADLHPLRPRPSAAGSAPIEESLAPGSTTAVKTPAQLAEVAEAAVRLDGVRQMVMTTGHVGRPRPRRPAPRALRARRCTAAVPGPARSRCRASRPPTWPCCRSCSDAGAVSIGIHVESLDDDVRRRWMPGKGCGADGASTAPRGARPCGCSAATRSRPTCMVGLGEDPDELVAGAPS